MFLGGVDGSLSMYCIADPRIQEKRNLLFNLPSRTGDLDTSQVRTRLQLYRRPENIPG